MKIIYTGLESSGKTLLMAKKAQELVARNKRWKKKFGFTRKILTNMIFSDQFKKANVGYLDFFTDVNQVVGTQGVDILWDEISSDFSALKREPLPRNVNRWLRQGAKQGVHIYATAQEFHDVHLDFRRRVIECYSVRKMFGSRRVGANLPPVPHIWGLCLVFSIKIHPYNELQPEKLSIIPNLLVIEKSLTKIFDTGQLISASAELPLEHIVRVCPTCGYRRLIHR